MTSKYDHLASTQYLSNLCKDGTPLRGRIALLSFRNEVSAKLVDKILMLIEYGQLLILLLRVNFKFYTEKSSNKIDLNSLLSGFALILSPGNLLPSTPDGLGLIKRVLDICFIFFVFRVLLFLYIIWLAFKRKEDSGILVKIWKWIFHVQTKAFHYTFASVYLDIYDSAFKNTLGLENNQRRVFMAACLILLILEFLFSFTLTSQLTNILPYKRFSAAKDNFSELTVLIQKITVSLLKRAFNIQPAQALWIYAVMNTIFGFSRVYHLLTKIQVYNYQSLKFQTYLICSAFAVALSSFAHAIYDHKKVNMNFLIITWIILTLLCVKFANAFLEKKLWTLAFEKGINKTRNPETLVHKIIFIKYILKRNKFPTKTVGKCDIHHLLNSTLHNTTMSTFDLSSTNVECKATRNKIFMHYLEDLRAEFPKNNFIKLYTAYHFARKMKLYGLSIKTLAEIKTSLYPTVVVSKSLLKHFIQSRIQSGYQNGDYKFNLYDYFKNLASLSKLKLKMAKQAKLQWDLCNQIANVESPDLAKILRLGNKASSLQQKIQKRYRKMSEQIPEYYIKPSLLYSYYNLFLKYSSEEHQKCQEYYNKKSQKYQKLFENHQHTIENISHDGSFTVIVSGEKATAGRINYISPGFEQLLGRDLTGTQANSLTPPFIRINTLSLIDNLTGMNALKFLNTQKFQFLYHLKGYMIPFNYYLSINPSIYGGISFVCINRLMDTAGKEFMILNEEGEIECFTKNIGYILGLFSKDGTYISDNKIQLSQICPEFTSVNHAFNVTAFPSRYKNKRESNFGKTQIIFSGGKHQETANISIEEAQKICAIYSSEQGQNLTLTPLNKKIQLTYSCIVRPLVAGNKAGKLLTLEKIHHDSEMNQEIVNPKNILITTPNDKHLLDVSAISSIDEQDLHEDRNCEKESAWINFERLKSENNPLPQLTTTITSPNDPQLTTTRNLLPTKSPRPHLQTENNQVDSTETKLKTPSFQEKPEKTHTHHQKGLLPHWLSQNKPKTMKVYQQALEKLYYPVFYRVLSSKLYAIFLGVFIMYLYMTVMMHQGISDIQISKQILRMAEARNNYLGTLDGSIRFLWTYATQSSNLTSILSQSIIQLPALLIITQVTTSALEKANNDLFGLTSSLDNKDRDRLFDQDIRIFDTNSTSTLDSFLNLTSFQATDKIVSTTLEALSTAQQNIQQSVPDLTVILRNSMNDMLVKNAGISECFKNSLDTKKDYFIAWVTNCFIVSLCLVILAIFGFLYILYLQAKSESSNMFALTRLKPESVQSLKQDLLIFRDIIFDNNQGWNLQENATTVDPFYSQSVSGINQQILDSAKSNHRNPIYKGLWLEYYLYFLKLGLLLAILLALFLANFILFQKYLNQLSDKAYQIHFIEQMNSRLGVLAGSFLELISENDTTVIQNTQASESLATQISDLSLMIESISDNLGFEISQDNHLVQDLLYGDSCAYLTEYMIIFNLCHKLANYQKKTGLINLLSNFEFSVNNIYTRFMDGDRDEDTLRNLLVEAFNKINMPVFMVIQSENTMIAEVLNQDFEQIVSHSQFLNITLNAVILVLIVVECFIIHFMIINKLKQKEMQFKKILGLFPANIVLPNFILKSYITKTSNQTFNSFRD